MLDNIKMNGSFGTLSSMGSLEKFLGFLVLFISLSPVDVSVKTSQMRHPKIT